jgi:hypothetical protein
MAVIASAHSNTPAAFNATFYATVAVIIPVLYLALVVQGGGVDGLLREGVGAFKSVYEFISSIRRRLWRDVVSTTAERVLVAVAWASLGLFSVVLGVAMTIVACLIAVAGGVSELCALYALYKQNVVISIARNVFGPNTISVNVSYVVLAGAGILIVATTVLPFAQLLGRVRAGKPEPPAKPPDEDKPLPYQAG